MDFLKMQKKGKNDYKKPLQLKIKTTPSKKSRPIKHRPGKKKLLKETDYKKIKVKYDNINTIQSVDGDDIATTNEFGVKHLENFSLPITTDIEPFLDMHNGTTQIVVAVIIGTTLLFSVSACIFVTMARPVYTRYVEPYDKAETRY